MLERKANYLLCVGPFSTESMGFHQEETKSKEALVTAAHSVNTLDIRRFAFGAVFFHLKLLLF